MCYDREGRELGQHTKEKGITETRHGLAQGKFPLGAGSGADPQNPV